jgi:hypothetical protein
MVKTEPHPHAEAAYRIVLLDGGHYGVEVTIPETHPTMVSGLASQNAAEAWISNHKARTRENVGLKRSGRTFGRKEA